MCANVTEHDGRGCEECDVVVTSTAQPLCTLDSSPCMHNGLLKG